MPIARNAVTSASTAMAGSSGRAAAIVPSFPESVEGLSASVEAAVIQRCLAAEW